MQYNNKKENIKHSI